MRVIDGMHRFNAAIMRGDDRINVQFFDGSESDAFVLAVRANIRHGRPLTLSDRTAAAERIIASHPAWSNRVIAVTTGLGPRLVGKIRRRLEETGVGRGTKSRMGRDGKVRPTDYAEGRLKASQIIKEQPHTSLRQIAKKAGVSPATARDVRNRLLRGEDPVPQVREPARRDTDRHGDLATAAQPPASSLRAMMRGLASDPSLRFSESGRSLLQWMQSRVLRPEEWRDISDDVPAHCMYILTKIAWQCANEWSQVVEDLQRRTTAA
jgi:hypothetical protein